MGVFLLVKQGLFDAPSCCSGWCGLIFGRDVDLLSGHHRIGFGKGL
jgi:hypothetical protein